LKAPFPIKKTGIIISLKEKVFNGAVMGQRGSNRRQKKPQGPVTEPQRHHANA